ncbi:SCO family protein [Methylotenera mobilis]|uniref:SCO family protein n=1 Tax=Methylotenera mobilis TaxID=359408 RepID=UPI0005632A38
MRLILLALFMVVLAGCNAANNEQKFNATDITGVDFGNTLNLTDHTGKPRSLTDFKGKVVALFFGYTHCPDVCPTTLTDMKQAMKLLGGQANELQVLFVTLDPERDTQALLAEYVPAFDASFIGLYGTKEQTASVLKDFKIFAAKVENKGRSGYTIDHSAGVYVFDKAGKIRLYIDYGTKPDAIASDVKKLL